jgi:putative RecB family exonuclease
MIEIAHASHSSISSYLYCGKAYELAKIRKFPEPPAWYLLGGSAVHTATEWIDTDGWDGTPEEAFHYAFHLACQEARESGWEDETQWRTAGYGNNKQGYAHWAEKGSRYVRQWAAQAYGPWKHVELDVSTTLPSGIKIKAYVDRVSWNGHVASIVDLKTGSTRPDSDQQLGVYSVLTEKKLGLPVSSAANYMFKDDEFYEMDVSNWTLETVDRLAQEWKNGVESEVFLPNRGSKCGRCGVADACFLQSGDTATTRVYDRYNPYFIGE